MSYSPIPVTKPEPLPGLLVIPGQPWLVLHVHPRCEKKMASYSALHSIVYYLPLKKETRVYQRRRVTFTKPVFAGYFFAALSDEGRLTLLKTNHIIRCIEIDRQEEFVHELNQVHRALDVDPGLGATASLPKGKRVRITGGPFMGIDGWVSSMKNPYKVWLHVDILGQAVSVEVDRVNLEVDE